MYRQRRTSYLTLSLFPSIVHRFPSFFNCFVTFLLQFPTRLPKALRSPSPVVEETPAESSNPGIIVAIVIAVVVVVIIVVVFRKKKK